MNTWIFECEKQIAYAERLRADPRLDDLPEARDMLDEMIAKMRRSLEIERELDRDGARIAWLVLVASLIVLLLQVGFAIWSASEGRWIPAVTAVVMAVVAGASAAFMRIVLRKRYGR